MQRDSKKFSFFCTEDMLVLVIKIMHSIDGVRLLHSFEKEFRFMLNRKNNTRRMRRHLVLGICPEEKMTEVVHILARNKVYGFSRVTSVTFSDLQNLLPLTA